MLATIHIDSVSDGNQCIVRFALGKLPWPHLTLFLNIIIVKQCNVSLFFLDSA
jgi:hypothetical protein